MTHTKAKQTELIHDGQQFNGAKHSGSGCEIRTYDDGFGPIWIHRNSIGISGIVRAQTWEDAYGICEDEFFPEAGETIDEIVKEYGFKREHVRVTGDDGQFVRWETRETPDEDAWMDNELFQEGFGFRPNGPNARDTAKHGIYAKDLNGDSLEPLTKELVEAIGIELAIEDEDAGE